MKRSQEEIGIVGTTLKGVLHERVAAQIKDVRAAEDGRVAVRLKSGATTGEARAIAGALAICYSVPIPKDIVIRGGALDGGELLFDAPEVDLVELVIGSSRFVLKGRAA